MYELSCKILFVAPDIVLIFWALLLKEDALKMCEHCFQLFVKVVCNYLYHIEGHWRMHVACVFFIYFYIIALFYFFSIYQNWVMHIRNLNKVLYQHSWRRKYNLVIQTLFKKNSNIYYEILTIWCSHVCPLSFFGFFLTLESLIQLLTVTNSLTQNCLLVGRYNAVLCNSPSWLASLLPGLFIWSSHCRNLESTHFH